MKFLYCEHCGNLVEMAVDKGVPILCCGQKMTELIPNTTDAAGEKHVPVVKVEGKQVTVDIGEVTHPMMKEHSILFICLETDQGWQHKALHPEEKPEAVFALSEGEKPLAAYEFCNLHGLWKSEIK